MPEIHTYLEALMLLDDHPRRFASGAVIFKKGAMGREMYVVRTGSVVLKAGRRTLETVLPGGIVGEMAIIDPAPRSATALAGDDCTVTAVSEHTFLDLVKRVPNLAIELMRIMARRLRRANEVRRVGKRRARPRRKVGAAAPATRRRRASRQAV